MKGRKGRGKRDRREGEGRKGWEVPRGSSDFLLDAGVLE